jgi:AraC-like DNA-binding protein
MNTTTNTFDGAMREPTAILSERLMALLESADDQGVFLSARAGNAYCLRSIRTSAVFFSVVLKGRKRIHHNGEIFETNPGNMVVISAGCCIDVENIPDPRSGEYLAALIVLPEVALNATRALLGEQAEGGALSCVSCTPASPCSVVPLELIAAEFEHCVENAAAFARPRFHHALVGLLLRLHESGIRDFLQPTRPRLADSVSSLLATEPARVWRSIDIEERLAMSGATLRRQLAAEQTSLRQILTETRLGQALQLLQSTRLPVKTVAARSGYRSVSSFVRRFHERYGVEPSRVANAN